MAIVRWVALLVIVGVMFAIFCLDREMRITDPPICKEINLCTLPPN